MERVPSGNQTCGKSSFSCIEKLSHGFPIAPMVFPMVFPFKAPFPGSFSPQVKAAEEVLAQAELPLPLGWDVGTAGWFMENPKIK
jgi:hypothetical protein